MYKMNSKASTTASTTCNTLAIVKNSSIDNYNIAILGNEGNILSSNVLNRFYSYLDVSPVSVRSYISGIRQFMNYLKTCNVVMPTRDNVLSFKKALIANGSKASTVALYLSAVRRFFAWCESEGIYSNIAAGIKSPKLSKAHKKDALSGSQLKACISRINRQTVEGKRNYAMFLLMACCGLRTCEVVRADVADIQQLQDSPVLWVRGKGRAEKNEFVKLSPEVMQAITEYLSARGQVSGDMPLFASCSRRNKGGRLTTRTVSSVAKSTMVQAGYNSTRLTAHSLRHSAATLAIRAGMPLQEVSEFLRHSDISITMVYVHSIARIDSECESAVSRAIFAA